MCDNDPGDQLYIDFAGKTWDVYDNMFGVESSKKQVFVANLGYSQYGYVEVVDSQTTEDFIGALRRCLEYLGGVPKCIVPDNLKAAVIKTDRYEPVLNRVLEDFANHYGTTILPTRSRKPKDKALVENMVKHVYSKIRGPLRDRKFFSLFLCMIKVIRYYLILSRMRFFSYHIINTQILPSGLSTFLTIGLQISNILFAQEWVEPKIY